MDRKDTNEEDGASVPRTEPTSLDAPSPRPSQFDLETDPEDRSARLASVVANGIAPRLRGLHHDIRAPAPFDDPGQDAIARFCAASMQPSDEAAVAFFTDLRARGHSLETLFIHLLEPAARRLGELWRQDECDFTDVMLGVTRMCELLAIFGADDAAPARDARHRALLISPRGENHGFGVDMVASFLRAARWDVRVEKGLDPDECAAEVAAEWIGVAGVTLSLPSGLETAARAIENMRRASLNPRLRVVVGGPVFLSEPELAARVGADALAANAPAAVIVAGHLLREQAL